jgi:Arc/MetJ-type ribon-helix-helix transcriptional regulator
MVTISVPITAKQEKFIKELVKSGRAANKAHAVRLGIDALAEDAEFASLQRSLQDAKEGRVFYGDLDDLAEKLRS